MLSYDYQVWYQPRNNSYYCKDDQSYNSKGWLAEDTLVKDNFRTYELAADFIDIIYKLKGRY